MKKYSIEQTNYIVRGVSRDKIKPGYYRIYDGFPEFCTQATYGNLEDAIDELEKNVIDFSVSEAKDALGDCLEVTESVISVDKYDDDELINNVTEYTLSEAKSVTARAVRISLTERAKKYNPDEYEEFTMAIGWEDWMNEFTESEEGEPVSDDEYEEIYKVIKECFKAAHTGVSNEKRTERLNIRILPSVKMAAEINADKEGRTLSNYIEELIKKDAQRR